MYHMPRDCDAVDKICRNCGQVGHIARACSRRFPMRTTTHKRSSETDLTDAEPDSKRMAAIEAPKLEDADIEEVSSRKEK